MIEVRNLSKRYGDKLAVDGLDFVVQPGVVTGFLGPNGAGKSTTMRLIAGLDEPSAGSVRVNGKDYRSAVAPMAELGDPKAVVLDEPVNGLDPEGVRWIRNLLKALAADGRTVFVSSHLMSEMAQTATRLIVVGRGRLIADTTVEEFVARASGSSVTGRTPEAGRLRDLLLGPDVTITSEQADVLHVQGLDAEQIGTVAWRARLPVFELALQQASLEQAFMELTQDSVEYRSAGASVATEVAA